MLSLTVHLNRNVGFVFVLYIFDLEYAKLPPDGMGPFLRQERTLTWEQLARTSNKWHLSGS